MEKIAVIMAILGMVGASISAVYLVLGLISPKFIRTVNRLQVLKRVAVSLIICYGLFTLGAVIFSD